MKASTFIILTILLSNTSIYAQQNNKPAPHTSKHHIALFNGATTNFSHKSTSYTVGIDYAYRFSKLIGAGLLVEYIAAEPDETLVGIPVIAHPYKGSKIFVAPMAAFAEDHHAAGHDGKREGSFAFRIGLGYDFHLGSLSIGPAVDFDFGKTEAINYGVVIGFGF